MDVIWSKLSLARRDDIIKYIASDNLDAALELDAEIEKRVDDLMQFPQMGRLGRIPGTRELIVGNYVVVYRIAGKIVNIITIQHGAQLFPPKELTFPRT